MGKLIKKEQDEGRLDKGQGGNRRGNHGCSGTTVKTLADYGLKKGGT